MARAADGPSSPLVSGALWRWQTPRCLGFPHPQPCRLPVTRWSEGAPQAQSSAWSHPELHLPQQLLSGGPLGASLGTRHPWPGIPEEDAQSEGSLTVRNGYPSEGKMREETKNIENGIKSGMCKLLSLFIKPNYEFPNVQL